MTVLKEPCFASFANTKIFVKMFRSNIRWKFFISVCIWIPNKIISVDWCFGDKVRQGEEKATFNHLYLFDLCFYITQLVNLGSYLENKGCSPCFPSVGRSRWWNYIYIYIYIYILSVCFTLEILLSYLFNNLVIIVFMPIMSVTRNILSGYQVY